MLDVSGQDATEAFEDVGHSDEAREILDGMLVGSLKRMVGLYISLQLPREREADVLWTTSRAIPRPRPRRRRARQRARTTPVLERRWVSGCMRRSWGAGWRRGWRISI